MNVQTVEKVNLFSQKNKINNNHGNNKKENMVRVF